MSTLPSRLRRIMREMRWSQTELAEAAGAAPSTVSRWITDGHKQIDPQFAFRLQDATGFCARWILLNEGPAHSAETVLDSMPRELREEQLRHAQAIVRIVRAAELS